MTAIKGWIGGNSTLVYFLIVLHSVSGAAIEVNPELVTHLRHQDPKNPHPSFTPEAQCMINMTDGKYVTVRETCAEVRLLIEQQRK